MQAYAGYKFFPAAFDPSTFDLACKLTSDRRFYRTFVSYVLKTFLDPTQLVHARSAIVNEVQLLAPHAQMVKTVWCCLSLASEQYFDEKAMNYAWSDEEREQAITDWFGLIAPGFIPGDYNRSLDISVLRNWKRRLANLQKRDMGPMAACDLCTSQCFYNYEVKVLEDHWGVPFDKARQREDSPKLAAHLALNLCASLGGAYDVDVAFCISAQTVQHQDSFEDAQYKFMADVRVEIEKAIDVYKATIAQQQVNETLARSSGSSPVASTETTSNADDLPPRDQVFEVIVRMALSGAAWRQVCRPAMLVNNIEPEEIEAEIEKRKKLAEEKPED